MTGSKPKKPRMDSRGIIKKIELLEYNFIVHRLYSDKEILNKNSNYKTWKRLN